MKIESYSLHRLKLPLPLPIGDSQVRFDEHWMTVLELHSDSGLTGTGLQLQQGLPTAALREQQKQFEWHEWSVLRRRHPAEIANQLSRPRGGNVGAAEFSLAVQTAVWDLSAQSLDLPLYRLLGGTNPRVPAYGSTLDFHLSDEQFCSRLEGFRERGFRAVKIKVGHPDVNWDLRRMQIAMDVFGDEADLMVDANEAWSPKEATLRLATYKEAGFSLFWVEDPITREDYAGYTYLSQQSPFRINSGEYLEFTGKRQLLQDHAVDVLNIHGHIAESRAAARLAGDFGIPVSLGNTILEIGVHIAASLPECLYLEFSDLPWNDLAQSPVEFRDGWAIAPERPGHGIALNRDALDQFACPE